MIKTFITSLTILIAATAISCEAHAETTQQRFDRLQREIEHTNKYGDPVTELTLAQGYIALMKCDLKPTQSEYRAFTVNTWSMNGGRSPAKAARVDAMIDREWKRLKRVSKGEFTKFCVDMYELVQMHSMPYSDLKRKYNLD